MRTALSGVQVSRIDAPANSSEARLAVQVQNELKFKFTGGGAPPAPTYRLTVQLSGSRTTVTASNVSGLPILENYVLNASFTLTEVSSNKAVMTGRAATTVGYDPSGTQRFARIGGMLDAERRAAQVISDNISTRLASFFASGS